RARPRGEGLEAARSGRMTMANTVSHDRDEVLYSFHRACPVPTAADVVAWAARYPEYADEIRAHASVALDWAARGELEEEVDESALSRAHNLPPTTREVT